MIKYGKKSFSQKHQEGKNLTFLKANNQSGSRNDPDLGIVAKIKVTVGCQKCGS